MIRIFGFRSLCSSARSSPASASLSQESDYWGEACLSIAACGISTKSASTISATTIRPSKPSRRASSISASSPIPAAGRQPMISGGRERRCRPRTDRADDACRRPRASPSTRAAALFRRSAVRRALLEAFDFEWANANLLSNLYRRTSGLLFGLGALLSWASPPMRASWRCSAMMRNRIVPAILDGTYELPKTDGSGRDRNALRRAVNLLQGSRLGRPATASSSMQKTGEPFTFTISLISKEQEKIALHYPAHAPPDRHRRQRPPRRLRRSSSACSTPTITTWCRSPGTIRSRPAMSRNSTMAATDATVEGTRNYPGIADPAVDRMIAALLTATSREDFVAAVRASTGFLSTAAISFPSIIPAASGWRAGSHRPAASSHFPVSRTPRCGTRRHDVRPTNDPIAIDVVSDVVCPWCYRRQASPREGACVAARAEIRHLLAALPARSHHPQGRHAASGLSGTEIRPPSAWPSFTSR